MERTQPNVTLPIGHKFSAVEGEAEVIGPPVQRSEFGHLRPIWDYPCRVKVNGRRRKATYVFGSEGNQPSWRHDIGAWG